MLYETVLEETEEMDYLDYKAKVLYQLGLTDFDEVKAYLEEKCANATTETKKRIQIDNAARKIMMEYYEGDRSFVASKDRAVYCYSQLRQKYPKMETLYEDVIIRTIGKSGLNILREAHMIETCAMNNGRKLYAL